MNQDYLPRHLRRAWSEWVVGSIPVCSWVNWQATKRWYNNIPCMTSVYNKDSAGDVKVLQGHSGTDMDHVGLDSGRVGEPQSLVQCRGQITSRII